MYDLKSISGRRVTADEFTNDLQTNSDWIQFDYRYNRGVVFDGDLPHLASKVTSISSDIKRVILGFNCFTSEVSECCMRAPEHSKAFNRTVKLYQAMARSSSTKKKGSSVTAADILANPSLSRLLVAAAKRLKDNQRQES